jgi:hypothetical protein
VANRPISTLAGLVDASTNDALDLTATDDGRLLNLGHPSRGAFPLPAAPSPG